MNKYLFIQKIYIFPKVISMHLRDNVGLVAWPLFQLVAFLISGRITINKSYMKLEKSVQ